MRYNVWRTAIGDIAFPENIRATTFIWGRGKERKVYPLRGCKIVGKIRLRAKAFNPDSPAHHQRPRP